MSRSRRGIIIEFMVTKLCFAGIIYAKFCVITFILMTPPVHNPNTRALPQPNHADAIITYVCDFLSCLQMMAVEDQEDDGVYVVSLFKSVLRVY